VAVLLDDRRERDRVLVRDVDGAGQGTISRDRLRPHVLGPPRCGPGLETTNNGARLRLAPALLRGLGGVALLVQVRQTEAQPLGHGLGREDPEWLSLVDAIGKPVSDPEIEREVIHIPDPLRQKPAHASGSRRSFVAPVRCPHNIVLKPAKGVNGDGFDHDKSKPDLLRVPSEVEEISSGECEIAQTDRQEDGLVVIYEEEMRLSSPQMLPSASMRTGSFLVLVGMTVLTTLFRAGEHNN